jgi:hypothetical protein
MNTLTIATTAVRVTLSGAAAGPLAGVLVGAAVVLGSYVFFCRYQEA